MNSSSLVMDQEEIELRKFVESCLLEDVGDGDHTTLACVAPDHVSEAYLLAKDHGIWAGNRIVQLVIDHFFQGLEYRLLKEDGAAITEGDIIYELKGSTASILTSERLILNMVQHLSGIATTTHNMAALIADLPTKLLDTRKTTPGLRTLEKWAVKMGGGKNHRMGLYDMIMIKDNHVDQCGSITLAVERVSQYLKEKGLDLKFEVETRSLEDVQEVMQLDQVDWVMLDNFSPALISEALQMIDGKKVTEASGGINASNIRSYAETGVDFISSGSLTQRAGALDLSLKMKA